MGSTGEDASDEEIFAELEKDIDEHFDMTAMRERRLEELSQAMRQVNKMRESNYGTLFEMTDEKEILKTSASGNKCVIHFYHRDFKRCQIMNERLEIIAAKYFETRFLKVFVENVPWLVEKLKIQVLPCVICFVDGIAKDRLIGFEDLGNNDDFDTFALEVRLQNAGVIDKPSAQVTATTSTTWRGEPSIRTARRGIRSSNIAEGSESD